MQYAVTYRDSDDVIRFVKTEENERSAATFDFRTAVAVKYEFGIEYRDVEIVEIPSNLIQLA
jgi:hypothetical protein